MAKKEATKKVEKVEKKDVDEAKAAKRAARKEALKNRPEGQRTNSKQIDIIKEDKFEVRTYGHQVKAGRTAIGILVTTVILDGAGKPVSVSETFVPGALAIKSHKGHGRITAQRVKGGHSSEEDEDDSSLEDED